MFAVLHAINEQHDYDAQIIKQSVWKIYLYHLENSVAVFLYWKLNILTEFDVCMTVHH
jgi:hypothetical protein